MYSPIAVWSGKNWSERIWDNNQAFANAVQDTVTLGLMTGQRYDEIRDNLLYTIGMDSTAGARYRAARLVRTECNYIANQGHLMGYRAAGLEQYIFLATLDLRTSEICRSLDGRRFDLAQAQAGTNLPPMHPNCRSTTIPADAAQLLSKIKRAARNPVTGKTVQVPGDMTYREWYEQYVSGDERALANERKIQNQSSDKRQYAEYQQILGENAPKTFADFQQMKYTNDEEWNLTRLDFSRRNQLQEHPEQALPNAEGAIVPDAKFSQYLFGGENESGLAKGQAFSSHLGYDAQNWKRLQTEIETAARRYPAMFKGNEGYGDRYEQRVILYGVKDSPANVVIGWIHKPDGTISMTSAYIKEAK